MHCAFCISCVHPSPQLTPALTPRPDLAVITWNLHGDAGDVERLLIELKAGRLTGGTPPGDFVLMLQEASARTRVEGLHWFFVAARRVGGVERGNAMLSSVSLIKTEAIELPRERQRRVAAVATIRAGETELMLVNAHLENRASWWKGGLPGDRARARQMHALLEQLPPGPAILGGDMNIWLGPTEQAYQEALASFPDTPGDQSLLTFKERLALDHLFYRLPPGWKGIRYRASSRYGSDHYPVVGVLLTH